MSLLRASTHSSRRLSFDSPSFYTSTSARSVPPGGDMFVPDHESSEPEECWRPGQVLPPIHHTTPPQLDLQSILQDMQNSIESNFKDLKAHLANLDSRVADIEQKQSQLDLPISSATSTPTSSESDAGRKRRSPPELQVIYFAPKSIPK